MKEKVNFWETSFFGIFNNPLYSYNSKTKLIDNCEMEYSLLRLRR